MKSRRLSAVALIVSALLLADPTSAQSATKKSAKKKTSSKLKKPFDEGPLQNPTRAEATYQPTAKISPLVENAKVLTKGRLKLPGKKSIEYLIYTGSFSFPFVPDLLEGLCVALGTAPFAGFIAPCTSFDQLAKTGPYTYEGSEAVVSATASVHIDVAPEAVGLTQVSIPGANATPSTLVSAGGYTIAFTTYTDSLITTPVATEGTTAAGLVPLNWVTPAPPQPTRERLEPGSFLNGTYVHVRDRWPTWRLGDNPSETPVLEDTVFEGAEVTTTLGTRVIQAGQVSSATQCGSKRGVTIGSTKYLQIACDLQTGAARMQLSSGAKTVDMPVIYVESEDGRQLGLSFGELVNPGKELTIVVFDAAGAEIDRVVETSLFR